MRHWLWLRAVMRIAGVTRASALDAQAPVHPLCKTLPWKRRFESIDLDGYDPDRIEATKKQSLKDFVGSKRAYAKANKLYDHPIWQHLVERSPQGFNKDWAQQQFLNRDLIMTMEADLDHAVALGLVRENAFSDYVDGVPDVFPLDLIVERFSSLDGLLAIVIAYRGFVDENNCHADLLREAIAQIGRRIANALGLEGEWRHTWDVLIMTRMQAWMPNFKPSTQDQKLAEKELSDQRERERRNANKADRRQVTQHVKGRAERRWRRKVLIRACNLALLRKGSDGFWPAHVIREKSELWEWLSENREKIASHIARAVDELMEDQSTLQNHDPAVDPLVMPEKLYQRRWRPTNSHEVWLIFGDTTPFDLIPVASPSKPWKPFKHQRNPTPSEDMLDWDDDAGDS